MVAVVDVLIEALPGAWTDVIVGLVPDIGVDVLVVVNVNLFAVIVTALRGTPAPTEAFRC